MAERRVHRVGSVTAGVTLVILGVLFILYELGISLDYGLILHFWPLILIGIGAELLFMTFRSRDVIYDFPAVILLFLAMGFSFCMGIADFIVKNIGENMLF